MPRVESLGVLHHDRQQFYLGCRRGSQLLLNDRRSERKRGWPFSQHRFPAQVINEDSEEFLIVRIIKIVPPWSWNAKGGDPRFHFDRHRIHSDPRSVRDDRTRWRPG